MKIERGETARPIRELFDHDKLRVYQASIDFLAWLENISAGIKRKTAARDHLLRASSSIPVNIAEASGKSSGSERRSHIDNAYGSSLECSACLDILKIQRCVSNSAVQSGKIILVKIVSLLIGFRRAMANKVREIHPAYPADVERNAETFFDHERLNVYQKALGFVRWIEDFRRNHYLDRSAAAALDKTSVGLVLNIAEGNGKFSGRDRCRFIEYSRTAALQAAATLDVIAVRNSRGAENTREGKKLLAESVRMLTAWRQRISNRR